MTRSTIWHDSWQRALKFPMMALFFLPSQQSPRDGVKEFVSSGQKINRKQGKSSMSTSFTPHRRVHWNFSSALWTRPSWFVPVEFSIWSGSCVIRTSSYGSVLQYRLVYISCRCCTILCSQGGIEVFYWEIDRWSSSGIRPVTFTNTANFNTHALIWAVFRFSTEK